ncbi:MAG TPA: acylphosphatase [Usitatibacter sp.]|nr:acylphosphatase [Usitatibacter sp.]
MTRRLVVRGRVQGVGFRHAMVQEAHELRLHGWVRNRRDGTVEAVIQGPRDDVEHLIEWAERGPNGAVVKNVEITDSDEAALPLFETRPTA